MPSVNLGVTGIIVSSAHAQDEEGGASIADFLRPSIKFPKPVGWVNDFAEALEPADEQKMNALIGELFKKARAELCIVTVRKVRRMSPASYAEKLAAKWKLGSLTANRCIMLLTAMENDEVAMYVGYKLRSLISPDAAAKLIEREVMPLFRKARYGDALYRGAYTVANMIARERGVALNAPPPPELPKTFVALALEMAKQHSNWLIIGLMVLIVGSVIGRIVSNARQQEPSWRRQRMYRTKRFQRGAGTFYASRYCG